MEWAEVAAVATGFTTRQLRDARDRLQRGGTIEYWHGGKVGGGRVTRWKLKSPHLRHAEAVPRR